MQLTINLPDKTPNEQVLRFINMFEEILKKEGVLAKIGRPLSSNDAWDNLDIEEIAVDTGIADFAENHDYYLYGNPKQC